MCPTASRPMLNPFQPTGSCFAEFLREGPPSSGNAAMRPTPTIAPARPQLWSVLASQNGTDVPADDLVVLGALELGLGAGIGFGIGNTIRWSKWEPGILPPLIGTPF